MFPLYLASDIFLDHILPCLPKMTRSHLLVSIVHLVASPLLCFDPHHKKTLLKDNEKRSDLTLLSYARYFEILLFA